MTPELSSEQRKDLDLIVILNGVKNLILLFSVRNQILHPKNKGSE